MARNGCEGRRLILHCTGGPDMFLSQRKRKSLHRMWNNRFMCLLRKCIDRKNGMITCQSLVWPSLLPFRLGWLGSIGLKQNVKLVTFHSPSSPISETKNKWYNMVGDVFRYMHRRIRVYWPVHLAAVASTKQLQQQLWTWLYTDRRVCSLGLLGLGSDRLTLW